MDSCDSCRYVYAELAVNDVPERLRALADDVSVRLHAEIGSVLPRRPQPEVWSALEYACHLRDVLAMQRERVVLAQTVDEPEYVPMDREALVITARYNEQDPVTVAEQLCSAAWSLAEAFEALDQSGWRRTGVYQWPTREARTMEWVGRHTVHELLHHIRDIDAGLHATKQDAQLQ